MISILILMFLFDWLVLMELFLMLLELRNSCLVVLIELFLGYIVWFVICFDDVKGVLFDKCFSCRVVVYVVVVFVCVVCVVLF